MKNTRTKIALLAALTVLAAAMVAAAYFMGFANMAHHGEESFAESEQQADIMLGEAEPGNDQEKKEESISMDTDILDGGNETSNIQVTNMNMIVEQKGKVIGNVDIAIAQKAQNVQSGRRDQNAGNESQVNITGYSDFEKENTTLD